MNDLVREALKKYQEIEMPDPQGLNELLATIQDNELVAFLFTTLDVVRNLGGEKLNRPALFYSLYLLTQFTYRSIVVQQAQVWRAIQEEFTNPRYINLTPAKVLNMPQYKITERDAQKIEEYKSRLAQIFNKQLKDSTDLTAEERTDAACGVLLEELGLI